MFIKSTGRKYFSDITYLYNKSLRIPKHFHSVFLTIFCCKHTFYIPTYFYTLLTALLLYSYFLHFKPILRNVKWSNRGQVMARGIEPTATYFEQSTICPIWPNGCAVLWVIIWMALMTKCIYVFQATKLLTFRQFQSGGSIITRMSNDKYILNLRPACFK